MLIKISFGWAQDALHREYRILVV